MYVKIFKKYVTVYQSHDYHLTAEYVCIVKHARFMRHFPIRLTSADSSSKCGHTALHGEG